MRLAPVLLITWSGLASAASRAEVASPDWSLDWRAEPKCSSETQLRADVARILRDAPTGNRAINAHARATQDVEGSWHVELVTEIGGESHERSFLAESCDASESALAVILAFAINPQAPPASSQETTADVASITPGAAPRVKPTQSATPPGVAPAPPPSAQTLVNSPREPWTTKRDHLFGISATLTLDLGTLPALTEGAQLGLGVYPGRVRFELSAADWRPRKGQASLSEAGATFSMLSADARAEYAWPLGRLSLGPALSAHFVRLKAAGSNGSLAVFDKIETSSGFGAGGLVAWRLSERVELRCLLEGLHWFNRPRFVVTEPNSAPSALVYQPTALVGQAALGATVRFF